MYSPRGGHGVVCLLRRNAGSHDQWEVLLEDSECHPTSQEPGSQLLEEDQNTTYKCACCILSYCSSIRTITLSITYDFPIIISTLVFKDIPGLVHNRKNRVIGQQTSVTMAFPRLTVTTALKQSYIQTLKCIHVTTKLNAHKIYVQTSSHLRDVIELSWHNEQLQCGKDVNDTFKILEYPRRNPQ